MIVFVEYISIHAPANGATARSAAEIVDEGNFNPRSGERSDRRGEFYVLNEQISIHAPANGATIFTVFRGFMLIFQSTLRRTERLAVVGAGAGAFKFQSTLRRTERHSSILLSF